MLSRQIDQELNNLCFSTKHKKNEKSSQPIENVHCQKSAPSSDNHQKLRSCSENDSNVSLKHKTKSISGFGASASTSDSANAGSSASIIASANGSVSASAGYRTKSNQKLSSLCETSKQKAESFNFNFGLIDTDELNKKHTNMFDPDQVFIVNHL